VLLAPHFGEREAREGGAGELQALLDRRLHRLVAGRGDDEHDEPVEPETPDRLLRQGDVAGMRRVEGAAEQPRGHSSSNSTTASGLTPAARSSSSVALPRTL
jgi:hypothetical protein